MGSFFGKSPSGSTQATTTSGPWAGQQPILGDIYNKAQSIGNTMLQFPNFQTYASPTSQQTQAIGAQTNLAQHDPTTQAATNGLQSYLNGSMLSAQNPAFQNVVNQTAQSIAPQIDSHFAANGRYGSGANANAFASSLANTAGQMAYQNYNDQSQNQLRSELLAPSIQGMNYNDIGALSSAGAQQQAFNQLPISQQLAQFQFAQDAPYTQANREAALAGGAIPGGGTSTSPYFNNGAGQALGAASMLFGGSGSGGTGPSLASNIGNSSLFNWGGDGSFGSGITNMFK